MSTTLIYISAAVVVACLIYAGCAKTTQSVNMAGHHIEPVIPNGYYVKNNMKIPIRYETTVNQLVYWEGVINPGELREVGKNEVIRTGGDQTLSLYPTVSYCMEQPPTVISLNSKELRRTYYVSHGHSRCDMIITSR